LLERQAGIGFAVKQRASFDETAEASEVNTIGTERFIDRPSALIDQHDLTHR